MLKFGNVLFFLFASLHVAASMGCGSGDDATLDEGIDGEDDNAANQALCEALLSGDAPPAPNVSEQLTVDSELMNGVYSVAATGPDSWRGTGFFQGVASFGDRDAQSAQFEGCPVPGPGECPVTCTGSADDPADCFQASQYFLESTGGTLSELDTADTVSRYLLNIGSGNTARARGTSILDRVDENGEVVWRLDVVDGSGLSDDATVFVEPVTVWNEAVVARLFIQIGGNCSAEPPPPVQSWALGDASFDIDPCAPTATQALVGLNRDTGTPEWTYVIPDTESEFAALVVGDNLVIATDFPPGTNIGETTVEASAELPDTNQTVVFLLDASRSVIASRQLPSVDVDESWPNNRVTVSGLAPKASGDRFVMMGTSPGVWTLDGDTVSGYSAFAAELDMTLSAQWATAVSSDAAFEQVFGAPPQSANPSSTPFTVLRAVRGLVCDGYALVGHMMASEPTRADRILGTIITLGPDGALRAPRAICDEDCVEWREAERVGNTILLGGTGSGFAIDGQPSPQNPNNGHFARIGF